MDRPPDASSAEPQVSILRPDGGELYRIDLGVPDLRYGLEYDGEEHHTEPEDRDHDETRRSELFHRFRWDVEGVRRGNVFGVTRDVEETLLAGITRARRRLANMRWPT